MIFLIPLVLIIALIFLVDFIYYKPDVNSSQSNKQIELKTPQNNTSANEYFEKYINKKK